MNVKLRLDRGQPWIGELSCGHAGQLRRMGRASGVGVIDSWCARNRPVRVTTMRRHPSQERHAGDP